MGPMDSKGRTVLPESQIILISIAISAMRAHFNIQERNEDERALREVLDILSAFGYLVMPQSVLDGSIDGMQNLLDIMREASGAKDKIPDKT